jgi:D-alanyl-D-alanine carboxypeptidase/D-alanyl-D-alanine-endopeptidase (penicillin-binding protein 4)
MIRQKGLDYVKTIFPAGGQSGTIKNDFKGINANPYVYAKSGSLRHTYDLSGILITNSGKVLIFSWMNNQFPGNSSSVKLSMEKLFVYLRDNY